MRTRALAHTGTAALIAARYYAAGEVSQKPILPYVTSQRITSERQHAMGSDTGLAGVTMQINLVASSQTELQDLALQIRGAFQDYSGTVDGIVIQRMFLENEIDFGFDQAGGSHARALDFKVWFHE